MKRQSHIMLMASTLILFLVGCAELPDDGADTKVGKFENLNRMRYIEIFLVGGNALTGNLKANVYNTMFTTNYDPASKDSAPANWVESLDLEALEKTNGALGASINGPKLWMPDTVEIPVGVERDFNGRKIPWCGTLDLAGVDLEAAKSGAGGYLPTTIARESTFTYKKGTLTFLIDDTDGNTWIMKGFEQSAFTYDEYVANRESYFKKLPEGWKLREKVLEKDLILVPDTGIAAIMPDENFCVYDKTGPGYSNYTP